MGELSRYGPWAVVAGGSEGVGAAFAQQLGEAGVSVVLLARKQEALAETADRVRATGVQVRTAVVDLIAADALDRVQAATDGLEIGLLVLNAGANTSHEQLVGGDEASVQRVLDLGITVPLALVRHFAAPMKERGRGGLLLVGSAAGYVGSEGMAAYAAVKAFSRILTEGLWLELQPYGVDVLHLVLGLTRTPAMERAGLRFDLPGIDAAEPDDVAREGLAQLPHGPVHFVHGTERAAEALGRLPRAATVTRNAERMRRLRG